MSKFFKCSECGKKIKNMKFYKKIINNKGKISHKKICNKCFNDKYKEY